MEEFVNTSMMMSEQVDVSSLAVNALEEEIQRCEIEHASRKESVNIGVKHISNLLAMLAIEPDTPQDRLIEQYHRETDQGIRNELCNQLVTNDNLRYISIRVEQVCIIQKKKVKIFMLLKLSCKT